MAGYWLKLYTEILDDPKYYRLSDNAKLGMYELMLVAKKVGQDGHLPEVDDIEFYTRRPADWWLPVIEELKQIEFIVANDTGDKIRKFEERQRALTNNEKQKYHRAELHKNEFACNQDVTDVSPKVTESKSKSKSTEIEKEIDVDVSDDGDLSSTFVELYAGLAPRNTTDQTAWAEAYSRMKKAGVTPAVMRRASREMAEKKLKVASPGSLVNPCLMVMQRDDTRKPDSVGQFAEYVNR
jgi:hypothetical protein